MHLAVHDHREQSPPARSVAGPACAISPKRGSHHSSNVPVAPISSFYRKQPRGFTMRRSFSLVIAGLLVAGCSGVGPRFTPINIPSLTFPSIPPFVLPSGLPTIPPISLPSAVPGAGRPVARAAQVGDCIGAGGTLIAVPCDSPEARYRLVTKAATELGCHTSESIVTTGFPPIYCVDYVPGFTPAIERDVAVDDCIALSGIVIVNSLHVVPCSDPSATHRVLAIVFGPDPISQCPEGTDNSVEFDRFSGTGRTLCLENV